jgi:subtilase family serine protease
MKGRPIVRASRLCILSILLAALLLAACGPFAAPTVSRRTVLPTTAPTTSGSHGPLAAQAYAPDDIRAAYDIAPLHQQGITGQGQTVVLIESFGDPTLQADIDAYNQRYNLPPITIQVIAPIGSKPFDPSNDDMLGWAGETALDAEIVHAVAPGAKIVVLTSPVSETEGTIGLPEFRQLEQYALDHHLGSVISMSWGVSEVTLTDTAGRAEIAKWDTLFHQATTQQGVTFVTGSGDNGATDFADLTPTQLSSTATTSFPSDDPWVTSAGGTTLLTDGNHFFDESAWDGSGGGFSRFFATPDYQKTLPAAVQSQLQNRRGVPDIAANADPHSGWIIRALNRWQVIGGTSAAAPFWAGLIALANQKAGHPLGFINPALYQLAQGKGTADFRDITTGNNTFDGTGDRGGSLVHVQGYPAVPGWDPITGLGSPDAAKLIPDLITAAGGS